MAVRVGEIKGGGRHPLVKARPFNSHALLPKLLCSVFYVGLVHRESEVLRRPFALIFLKHNHSCLTSGAQEHPISRLITRSHFESQNFPVKRLGARNLLDADGDFVKTSDG